MNRKLAYTGLSAAVITASMALMLGATSAWLVGLSGFFFVIGGTLLTSMVSEGYERVEDLLLRLPVLFREHRSGLGDDTGHYLYVAACYRRGIVRQAEMGIKEIKDPYLALGAQLIVDRCSQKELERALQWQLSHSRERQRRRLRTLNSMASFAPAFGMLGTLLGLVHLLFSLGESELDVVGAAMGFAMITTVYGLVAANLLIKPMAIKMEQRFREQLAWEKVKHEMIALLFEKSHPEVIQDTLNAFLSGGTQFGRMPASGNEHLANA